MSESNRGAPRIQFSDGTTMSSFQRFSAHDTYTDPITRFEFDTAPLRQDVDVYRNLIQKGEFVTLVINGASQGGFLIETVRKRISAEHGISFHAQCLSPLITPSHGSVDPDIVNIHAQTDVDVSVAILQALKPYGFDRIVTDSRANVSSLTGFKVSGGKTDSFEQKLKLQDAQAQHGETAYAFCARLLNRLGVCMRMSVDGVLLVGAPDYIQNPIATVVSSTSPGAGAGDRFIGEVEITDTNDEQFSEVQVRGNRVTNPDTDETSRPKAALKSEDAFKNDLSVYRSRPAAHKPKIVYDKHSRDAARCNALAGLVHGMHASRAWQLKGTVDGFVSQTGAVWSVDTVVHTIVESEGIYQPLWVLEREFTLSETDGSKTHLTLIPLGSLLLGTVPD